MQIGEPVSPPTLEHQPALIAQHLQLLAYFWPHILVVGEERGEALLEGVDVAEGELGMAQALDAAHDFDQPAAGTKPLIAQKQCLAP